MGRTEAADKLGHYANKFGEWIRDLTPAKARRLSEIARETYELKGGGAAHLHLLSEAVQYGTVAECLELLQQPQPLAVQA